MKKILLPLLLTLVFFTSCVSSTKPYVEPPFADPYVPAEEKLLAGGATHMALPEPECYFDAKEFLARYTEIISEAEDYILISTFLGSGCEGLEEFYDTLARKAEEGVDVYLILDAISSLDMTESKKYMYPLYFLKESGVHLIEYSPMSILRIIAPQNLIIRDHRKLVVVDGKTAVLGGMNMNYISLGSDDVIDLQKDSMYVFESANLAACLTDEFVTIWNTISVTDHLERSSLASYEDEGDLPLSGYLFNQGPGTEASMSAMYASLISSAESEIVMLPYMALLDENMFESLKSAVARGVKVKMYLPIDSRDYVQKALYWDYWRLVDAGFEVWFEYSGRAAGNALLHQKLMIVDGRWTVIGSSNFNYRSMKSSFEIALAIESEAFAEKSLTQVEEISRDMFLLTPEEAKRLKKEKGNFFNYLFSYYGG